MPSHSSSSAPIATVLVCAAALTGAAWARHHSASKKTAAKLVAGGASSSMPLPAGAFDVVVVGAGPAGCTAAYYLAKGGARVALLEREKSPRSNNTTSCHGALHVPAVSILKDMGVLADLHGTVLAVASSETAPAKGLHVQRKVLDSTLAAAASEAGADLRRGFEVSGLATSFDAEAGMWTVRSTRSSFVGGPASRRSSSVGGESGESVGGVGRLSSSSGGTGNEGGSIAARLLILADGAASKVAAELGFVKNLVGEGEEAAVVVLPSSSSSSAALPPKQRVASSGVPRSHGDHWLIVGDAAGHAEAQHRAAAAEGNDGEKGAEGEKPATVAVFHGIHTAMRGGELAAEAALCMRSRGDFSYSATKAYERAWRKEFGSSIVDAWPRAVRKAVESRSDLLETCSSELRRLNALVSSRIAGESLRAKASSTAEAAKTALQSAAASAVAAARFGASRVSFSGDGAAAVAGEEKSSGGSGSGSGSSSSDIQPESTAEAATASVEVSISPSGKGGGNDVASASRAAEEEEVAAA